MSHAIISCATEQILMPTTAVLAVVVGPCVTDSLPRFDESRHQIPLDLIPPSVYMYSSDIVFFDVNQERDP